MRDREGAPSPTASRKDETMELFPWSDDYSVGVGSIDAQHKKLVSMLNALHDGMSHGAADTHMSELLAGLIDYTAQHFAHEEELFAEHAYPKAEEHIAEHKALVAQVLEFQRKFESKQASISMELMMFLKNWLIGHILGSDKQYSALMVEKRVP